MRLISIFHLAILRAAKEGVALDAYVGSTSAMSYWLDSTREVGLIDPANGITEQGLALMAHLASSGCGVDAQGKSLAVDWPDCMRMLCACDDWLRSRGAIVEASGGGAAA